MNTEPTEKVETEIRKPKGKNGGKRPGSGRKKGTPNFTTRELKEIARKEAPVLVRELIRLATRAESEAVRVARRAALPPPDGQPH